MDDTPDDDAGLARRLASGDRTALAAAFDRFAPTLTRYAWAIAPSSEAVESLVQDTFLTLWRTAERLELATDSLLPWLLAVCRDQAGDAAVAAPSDQLRFVRDTIAALPEADRRLCELCLEQGRPYPEAARVLGLRSTAAPRSASPSRRRPRKAVTHDER